MKSKVIASTGLTHGMCVTNIILSPTECTEAHYHTKTTEVYTVLLGTGLLKHNQNEVQIRPGESFLIEPTDVHQVVNTGNVDLVILSSKDKPRQSKDYYPVTNF